MKVHSTDQKLGRPATGHNPVVSTRLPKEIIAAIDDWAKQEGENRANAIRRLVEIGLKAKMKK